MKTKKQIQDRLEKLNAKVMSVPSDSDDKTYGSKLLDVFIGIATIEALEWVLENEE